MGDVKQAFKLVFSRKSRILLALLLAFVIYSMFILVNHYYEFQSAISAVGAGIAPTVFYGALSLLISFSPLNFIVTALVALLSGFVLVMIGYKFKYAKSASGKAGIPGMLGVFSGALVASCPACTIALISIIGLGGSLAILPFQGLEFGVLALILLAVSLISISKSLVNCEECKI